MHSTGGMHGRPNELRVAIDLTALEDQVYPGSPGSMQVRFVHGLTRLAPEVDFVVLTRPGMDEALAHLDAANVRRLSVPDPSRLDWLLIRLDARLPGRSRRALLARGLAWPKSLRHAYSEWRPSVLARLRAHVAFCPFTSSSVRDPSVPLVAAIHDLQHLSHPHLLTSPERAAQARAFAATSRRAHRIVCSTSFVRDVALDSDGLPPDRVLTLSPGRLLEQPPVSTAAVAAALARHDLRENGFLLFSADFEARHNHGLVLTALGLFRARHPASTMKVIFAGSPNARMASLRTAVERMGLAAAVQFAGALRPEERVALIQGCRAVLIPSLYETIGEIVLEAMALGRPVVCSQVPGLAELVGSAALTFDPHQTADLVAVLDRTEREPGLLDRLAQLGRQRVAMLDDAQTVAQAYLTVFREAQSQCLASR